MNSTDRPSSLLTPRQREILHGDGDIGERANRAARARIRERLQACIFDLHLIVTQFPLEDIDKALTEPDDYNAEPGTSPPLANNMPALPALVYLYHRETETTAENQPDGWRTARSVERGVKQALTRMGVGYDRVDVDIQVDRTEDLETLAERELATLGADQLTQLHRAGLINSDDFADAWVKIHEEEE